MSNFKLMVQEICRDICELPDYNSPEDQPDVMLCTGDELECILERRVEPAISRLTADNERLRAIMRRVEPHLDAIICYASSMDEHEPNRIAHDFRAALNPEIEGKPT